MPASKPVLPALPFAEAVDFFRAKGKKLDPTFAWQDYQHEDHFTGFTVAKSTGFDILKDLHQSMADALANGTLEKDWQRQIIPILQAKGWWGRQEMVDPLTGETKKVQLGSLRRLHVIFDTNLRTANAAGRWAQIARSADLAPYLRYSAVLDSRTRPLHRAWNGTILRWDDPWWNTHFPPNGWFCRCTVTQMSDLDLTRFGLTVSAAPPADPTPPRLYVNPRTGEVTEVPAGIDPGFAYNPGRPPASPAPPGPPPADSTPVIDIPIPSPPTPASIDGILERAVRTAISKWVDAPPSLTAAAQAGISDLLPALAQDYGSWLDTIASGAVQETGDRRVVGALSQEVLDFLAQPEIAVIPESGAITLSDRDVIHFIRQIKQDLGKAPSMDDLRGIPEALAEPQAILWDKRKKNLLYVYPASDDPRSVKLAVEINAIKKIPPQGGQPRQKVVTNTIVHASRLDARVLGDENTFEVIRGGL